MTRWKDKVKAGRAVLKAKAVLAKDKVSEPGRAYHAALKASRDRKLQAFYKANLLHHKKEEIEGIIRKGLEAGEITEDQVDILNILIAWTGEGAFER